MLRAVEFRKETELMAKHSFHLGVSILAVGLAMAALVPAGLAAGKSQTLTGEVSDSMCGKDHMMQGSKADCTRACVRKGSKYALVVGDKVYTLETTDKTSLDALDKLAGQQATITGAVNEDEVQVKSVAAAK